MNNILYSPKPSDLIFHPSLIQEDGSRAEAGEVIKLELRFAADRFVRTNSQKNPTEIDRVTDGLRKAGLK